MQIAGACFGIAAPVIEGRAKTPNLNWTVSAESLAELLRIDRVGIINDLEATAHGIPALNDSQLLTLNTGAQVRGGHCALIAAGTGLGMAIVYQLVNDHNGRIQVESEAGKGTSISIKLPAHGRVMGQRTERRAALIQ